MSDVAKVRVGVEVDGDSLSHGLDGAASNAEGGFLARMGGLGRAGGLAIAGGIAAAGAVGGALFAIGSSFDDAFDTIRTSTGAVGDELAGLEETFRGVVHDVPTDFGSAADAVSALNQRLNLSGEPLEALSEQFIQLANVTGGDLAASMDSGTTALEQWAVPAGEMAGRLDEIFRASQETGVSFDDLSGQLGTFGPTLRQMGLGFDESTALLGSFAEHGVDADSAMAGLQRAVGRLADAGQDPADALQSIFDQIRDAPDDAAAASIAMDTFGRSGVNMGAAIRSGALDIGTLTDAIANGSDTINTAAEDTADFAERWQLFKNRVLLALEPIALRVFDAVGALFDRIAPFLENFIEQVSTLFEVIAEGDSQGIGEVLDNMFGNTGRLVGPVRETIEFFQRNLPILRDIAMSVFGWFEDNVPPVLERIRDLSIDVFGWLAQHVPPVFAALRRGAEQAFGWLEEHVPPVWEAIREGAETAFAWLQENVPPALDAVLAAAEPVVEFFERNWQTIGIAIAALAAPLAVAAAGLVYAYTRFAAFREGVDRAVSGLDEVFQNLFEGIRPVISDFVAWWDENWENIRTIVVRVATVISAVIGAFVATIVVLWNTFGDTLVDTIVDTVRYITRTLRNAFRVIEGIIGVITSLLSGDWAGAWENLGLIVSAVFDQILNTIRFGWENIKTVLSLALDALPLLWGLAWDAVKAVVGLAIDALVFQLVDLPRRLLEALGDLGGFLADKGTQLIKGLYDAALAFTEGTLLPWVQGLPGQIVGWIGDLARVLWDKGTDLIGGLLNAAEEFVTGTVVPWVTGLPGRIVEALGDLTRVLADKGRALIAGLWDGWVEFVNGTLIPGVAGFPQLVFDGLGAVDRFLWAKGKDLLAGLWQGWTEFVNDTLLPGIARLPEFIADSIGDGLHVLYQFGKDLVQGILNGIRDAPGSIAGAITSRIPGGGLVGGALGHVPGFAAGVSNFSGGLALVGERGPEVVQLPSGTDVISNHALRALDRGQLNGDVSQGGARTYNFNGITRAADIRGELEAMDRRDRILAGVA